MTVSQRIRSIAAAAASSALLAVLAAAQTPNLLPPAGTPPRAAQPAAPAPPPAIAVVGGTARVSRDEFEARARDGVSDYRRRSGSDIPENLMPLVRRQILESLIRRELLVLEASRRGILGSPAEAESLLRQSPFFNPGGRFDPTRWQQARAADPQMVQAAITDLQRQLGARTLNDRIEVDFRPSEAEIRERAEQSLARVALDALGLSRTEFSGQFPEPREADVVAAYARRGEEFRRPERATLSVILLAAADPAAAGTARATADSLVRALRSGGEWPAAGAAFNVRTGVIVTRDNFPGFWRGDARLRQAVFEAAPGSVLDEPVPSSDGWLVARVDEVRPSHVPPLREIARELRAALRQDARDQAEERELRAIYATVAESLRATAVRVRVAAVDTSRLSVPEPSASDLDRWYRGHMADYSGFDAASASIQVKPFAEVRDDVRRRMLAERRARQAGATVDAIDRAWRTGRRDGARERQAGVREWGPVVPGSVVDTGRVAAAVSESLATWGAVPGVRRGRFADGPMVVHVHQVVPDYVPGFGEARPILRERRDAARAAADERGGRALFDADPRRFAKGEQVHFSRWLVRVPDVLDVPLRREEVERYHREHIDRYSAPEEVRARHILVSSEGAGADADAAARAEVEGLLRRVRAGEDFGALAREHSDDPATRATGGDLGFFGRGAMLDAFERAVFSLRPGETSDVVRTEVGYHIIQCTEFRPAVAQPLATMWANVGADAAIEKAERLAQARAESLYRAIKTPAQLRAAAKRLGLEFQAFEHTIGDRVAVSDLKPVLERMERLKPGEIYPGAFSLRGAGTALAIVDSITPARAPAWNDARVAATQAYRSGAGERALEAKAAELDSLIRSGWSFDSVAALWGGLRSAQHGPGGNGIPGIGGGEALDSLLFGRGGRAAMKPGETSDWIDVPSGVLRVRYNQRVSVNPTQLASRIEGEREAVLNERRWEYFEGLKKRFPVRILDPALREVQLPPPRAR